MSIIDHKIAGRVTIESDDNLKTKLRAFGIKHQAQEHDNLTKDERSAIRDNFFSELVIIHTTIFYNHNNSKYMIISHQN